MQVLADMAARFRLAELLRAADMSQRQLSQISGVSPSTINRIATNQQVQVALATLASLADALSPYVPGGVRPGDLIEDVPERPSRRAR